jgi:hypothetical protein
MMAEVRASCRWKAARAWVGGGRVVDGATKELELFAVARVLPCPLISLYLSPAIAPARQPGGSSLQVLWCQVGTRACLPFPSPKLCNAAKLFHPSNYLVADTSRSGETSNLLKDFSTMARLSRPSSCGLVSNGSVASDVALKP